MNTRKIVLCVVTSFLVALSLLESGLAQKSQTAIPDFTRGDKIPERHNHDWTLGPTGARGWIYSRRLETTEARQILITKVEDGSPADGILQVGDVILGVQGNNFQVDPRAELGKAITAAESKDGRLSFTCWRKGKTSDKTVQIEVLGSYSTTTPFDCTKSKLIFDRGCDALAVRMKANPKAGNGIVRSLNALALLSSGREEFLPIIREQVKWAATWSDVEGRSLCCWFYGPINMLLAEYTLATGDKTYLPDLRRITMEIVHGQSDVGSWGHRFARPDGRLNGYGMMNAPGLPLTVSLILAREAGVDDPALDEAIAKSTRLMRFYVGKGCVPYGDHAPWIETHDDNGKNGIAALLFNLLEDREAAEYFSRMSVACHGNEREMGHTGNFFNMLWAMPGVALSGPQASGAWMSEFGWYYDLARRWDGTWQHQGPAQPNNDSYFNWDSTGAYLLAYAQPLRKLYITGRKQGFVDQVDKATAQNLIADGRGYSHRQKDLVYAERSDQQLLTALSSWSPVVRERAATAIGKREGDFAAELIVLLDSDADLYTQLGACQALAKLGQRAEKAVPNLRQTLKSDDLWLRIKAAEALTAMGPAAQEAIPELLSMLAKDVTEADPRGMQQRFLCFTLFDRRSGMLGRSLDGVDRDALYQAVRAGLGNEDGRARSTLGSVYNNLSYDEIKPLLPAIYHAVVESAPSGMMFADGIRLSGLEILAKHQIQEAMPLCIEIMELDRWGAGKRIPKCLNALKLYGGAAKELLPKLEPLQEHLANKKRKNDQDKKQMELLQETIEFIRSADDDHQLRALPKSGSE